MEYGKMLILSNVLALALIAADEPKPAQASPITITGHLTGTITPQEVWHMTLPEAIRIGLDNSEVVRVISKGVPKAPVGGFEPTPLANNAGVEPLPGPGVVIARLNSDASPLNFKAAIMAHVRSIEQQYWALSQQHITLWSRETAVRLGTELLARERAELVTGRGGNNADIAEAEQQLENYKLNLVSATSDLMTTEKQLRNILGLPAHDNRRIVPATPPTEAKVEPKWEDSVAAMLASQPDIAQQRQLIGVAELRAIIEGENPTLPVEQREASQRELEKQQDFLKQILHQTTHSLARFFFEIDASYKQFRTARTLREAAQKRLEAQRAFYEEGRVTIDRLLDAVTQYTNAIAQESLYKTTYNTSIAALEEAKGTLLVYDKITVLDQPIPRKPQAPAKVDAVAPASFEGPAKPAPAPVPAAAQPAATTYKLKAKLGGEKFLEIEVEVNPVASPSPAPPG
jgi:hypothetical protein